jgi:hypothetical protein
MTKAEGGCKRPTLYEHAFNIVFLIVLMCFNLIILVLIMIVCLFRKYYTFVTFENWPLLDSHLIVAYKFLFSP